MFISSIKAWFSSWFKRSESTATVSPIVVPVEPVVDRVSAVKAAASGVLSLMDRAIEIVASLDSSLKIELTTNPNSRTAILAAVLENGGNLKDGAAMQDAAALANDVHVLSVGRVVFEVAVFLLGRFAPNAKQADLELAIQWAYRSYQILRAVNGK